MGSLSPSAGLFLSKTILVTVKNICILLDTEQYVIMFPLSICIHTSKRERDVIGKHK